jgi:hypothetical protein
MVRGLRFSSRRWASAGVLLGAAAGCSGVTLEEEPAEAGAGTQAATAGMGAGGAGRGGSSLGGRGGTAGRVASTGGSSGTHGASATGASAGSVTVEHGGFGGGPSDGAGGDAAPAGGTSAGEPTTAGGSAGEGGGSGDGGAAGRPGTPSCDAPTYSEKMIGWRCESAESFARGSSYERVDGASLDECFAACSARQDCTAVTDFLGFQATGGVCVLSDADCETPVHLGSAEEDGIRYHRKTCDEQHGCRMEELTDFLHCDDAGGSQVIPGGGLNFAACTAACLADPTCTMVRDTTYLRSIRGCYLTLTSCDAPFRSYQDGLLYVKHCD